MRVKSFWDVGRGYRLSSEKLFFAACITIQKNLTIKRIGQYWSGINNWPMTCPYAIRSHDGGRMGSMDCAESHRQ